MTTGYDRDKYRPPISTTDIIIDHCDGKTNGIVLIERRNAPYGLAIPGGFAEYGLTLEQNAMKEAKEETGLDVLIKPGQAPLGVYSDPARDPRGHMISVVYVASGKGTLNAGDDAKGARVYSYEEVTQLIKGKPIDGKNLVFDHAKILEDYLRTYEFTHGCGVSEQ